MTRLVKGQNIPWPESTLQVVLTTEQEVDLSCLLLTAHGQVRSDADLVFYNAPTGPGVSLNDGVMTLDLPQIPLEVEQLRLLVSVDPAAPTLGASPILTRCVGAGTTATFETTLDTERAAHLIEVYRRSGGWKVRAVGQGWTQGLRHALELHGIRVDDDAPTTARPPAPDSAPLERALGHLEGIRADLAAAASAHQSTCEYAADRLAADLEQIAIDPSLRGSAAHSQTAQQRHDELVATAAARYRQDLEDLQVEISTLEEHLPRELASLNSPVWQRAPGAMTGPPAMIRVGTMAVEGQHIGLPIVSPLPGRPVLLIGPEHQTLSATRAFLHRVTTDVPQDAIRVHQTQGGLTPELRSELARRADLVSMALESGVDDAITHVARPLLVVVVSDFSARLDPSCLSTLQQVVSCGPAAGVQLVLVTTDQELDAIPAELAQECQIMGSQVCAVLAESPHLSWSLTPDTM